MWQQKLDIVEHASGALLAVTFLQSEDSGSCSCFGSLEQINTADQFTLKRNKA